MKVLLFTIIFSLVVLSDIAQENNNKHKNYIEIGYDAGAYSDAFTGGVFGAAGTYFNAFGRKCSLDFRVKENYIVSPEREAGDITVTFREYFSKGFYIGLGGAHNHETNIKDYGKDPVGSTMGNGKYIIHRTGMALETGYDFRSFIKKRWLGIYPVTNLCVAYLMGDKEPNPVVLLSVGFRFGFKQVEEQ